MMIEMLLASLLALEPIRPPIPLGTAASAFAAELAAAEAERSRRKSCWRTNRRTGGRFRIC
jgi:hypothetical protein